MLGTALAGGLPHSTSHGCHCVAQFTGALALLSLALSDTLILSNCLDSVNESHITAWALCVSTLLAHAHTPPLVMYIGIHYLWPLILLLFPLATVL